ncbi:hypothetical protein ACJX0J_039419, partial [Zea mays]
FGQFILGSPYGKILLRKDETTQQNEEENEREGLRLQHVVETADVLEYWNVLQMENWLNSDWKDQNGGDELV